MWAKILILLGAACTCFAQNQTHGASDWGTLDAPTYPPYLDDNREGIAASGPPWGIRSASNTNPYEGSYSSGITRRYTFDISRVRFAPDGYEMNALLINGQFPGPLIEANWGDMVEVTVNNHITDPIEGTSIHWHGFLQKGTPWYDGVPAVTQCPIVSGGSFTYTFKADLYGTSWYHSHFSAQYAGGLFGPIIVHGPNIVDYDIDLGPIMLSDHYHQDYFNVLEKVAGTDSSEWLQKSDNNLINGRMDYDCSLVADGTPCSNNTSVSKFRFHTHKRHRLRLINTSAEALQRFGIDGHKLTVMANDFVPVWPYEVDYVTLGVGQRMDVIVEGIGPSNASYWMRSNISYQCSLTLQPHARAAVYYEDADTDAMPTTPADNYPDDGTCITDPISKTFPVFPMTPPIWPDATQTLDIGVSVNDTGHQVWTVNNSSAQLNYNYPPYLLANKGNFSSYDSDWNVYHFFNNGSVRLVLNNFAAAHPVHIHGHNMYVLHEGPGRWDGWSIERYFNPQRRDTQMLRSGGHIVIQYDANNPGAWALHCHIAWHVSMGFYMTVMEKPHEIDSAQPPPNVWENCERWNEYTEDHIVHQIDSGV